MIALLQRRNVVLGFVAEHSHVCLDHLLNILLGCEAQDAMLVPKVIATEVELDRASTVQLESVSSHKFSDNDGGYLGRYS